MNTEAFHSLLGQEIQTYVDYKRALGRKFATEARALHLLDRFLVERAITDLSSYAGRQFERSFAELATKLYDDINNWDETAKRCLFIS